MPTAKTIPYRRPPLVSYQTEFVDAPVRYTLVEASTKVGKTVSCIIWLVEQALKGRAGWHYWWVAPVSPQSAIAFRRLKEALDRVALQAAEALAKEGKSKVVKLYEANESDQRVMLPNGTTIWFKHAEKPNHLYGEDVYACVIDEASRVREESWWAIRTTLTATKGPIKIIGNVKGRRNWAYRMAYDAKTGTIPDMAYFKITAWDAVAAGILDRAEIEDAKRVLPGHVFRQDYEAEPAEDEGNPFGGSEAIEACIEPLSQADPAVWGWDLAKSHDWVVGIALDRAGRVCRLERWQAPWRSTKRDIIQVSRQVPTLIDSTGVGDPILEDLQAAGMDVQGYNFGGSQVEPAEAGKYGSPVVTRSKQQLMEGLAMAIKTREVRFPEGVIVDELKEFEYRYTRTGVVYSAPSGMFDDCVCALALAWKHWKDNVGSGDREATWLRNVLAAYEQDGAVEPPWYERMKKEQEVDPKVW